MLSDMAADTVGLLDALGYGSAHLAGVSSVEWSPRRLRSSIPPGSGR